MDYWLCKYCSYGAREERLRQRREQYHVRRDTETEEQWSTVRRREYTNRSLVPCMQGVRSVGLSLLLHIMC